MSPSNSRSAPYFLFLAALCLVGDSSTAQAKELEPIEVHHSVSIRTGDWTPLPVEDMRRAAVDPALARLTDAGRLRIDGRDATSVEDPARGRLDVAISLIGPAETVKVTMTLDVPGAPTLVATAAISVRGLDYREIYEAFEHAGERSAERLVAKLDQLAANSVAGVASASTDPKVADPARREIYSAAQADKRAGRYAEARAGFESVAATSPNPQNGLRRLAEDELRYGLPLSEAQQATNLMARLGQPSQQAEREAALTRAENLYRQIEAENQHNFDRIAQAQRAIDSLLVTRRAVANAQRANAQAQASSIRTESMEFSMMEGRCPDQAFVSEALSRRPSGLALRDLVVEAQTSTRYRMLEPVSERLAELLCGPAGVELVDRPERREQAPAAIR